MYELSQFFWYGIRQRNFVSEPVFTGDVRCDLHPRWSADGRQVSIDSVAGGDRQIVLIDVSDIVDR